MAARLEWKDGVLVLGPFTLANVTKGAAGTWRMTLDTLGESMECEKERYQNKEDCVQDCMAEVRRLLRESGVVLDG